MTSLEKAAALARTAIYGTAQRTPADYTLLEALQEMRRQSGEVGEVRKRRRYEKDVVVQDAATGPIFEEENQ